MIGITVGILADIIFGAVLGIIFVYFLKFTNHQNIIIKGWGFGVFAWLFFFGILMSNLPGAQGTIPVDALAHFSVFIGHSIYGIMMGFSAKVLLDRYNLVSDEWK
jgi:uncharacterized membrane protein YagU involved in acid resistance